MIETFAKKLWVKFIPPAQPLVQFIVDKEALEEFRPLMDKDLKNYVLTLKRKSPKSKNMNNYMWQLCGEIANKKSKDRINFFKMSKDEIYKQGIREVGRWFDEAVDNDKTQETIAKWNANGIGWFCETVFRGENETTLRFYIGSSVYTGEQLYRLTNYIVDMAKEEGIPTDTEDDLLHLKMLWEGR